MESSSKPATAAATKPSSAPLSALVTTTTQTNAAAQQTSGCPSTPPASGTPTSVCPATLCGTNVVTIPVPIVSQEDIYAYITIKGSLHDRSSCVFGLNNDEITAISKRFENQAKEIVNGIMINTPPMLLINALSQLGYKVICSTGEAEIVWTMQREV